MSQPGGGGGPGGGDGSGPGGMGAEDMTPNPSNQDELDSLICNIFRSQDSAIPTDTEYTNRGS